MAEQDQTEIVNTETLDNLVAAVRHLKQEYGHAGSILDVASAIHDVVEATNDINKER